MIPKRRPKRELADYLNQLDESDEYPDVPPELTVIDSVEGLTVRLQDPERALDDYLAAMRGEYGDVPAVMARNAGLVVGHLEGALNSLEHFQALVDYQRDCWTVRN